MKKIILILLCLGVVVGCKSTVTTPEGGSAEYSTAEGVMRSTLAGAMPEVVAATNATLTDLELVAIDSTVDKLKGKITARMAVGTKVTINLEAVDFAEHLDQDQGRDLRRPLDLAADPAKHRKENGEIVRISDFGFRNFGILPPALNG